MSSSTTILFCLLVILVVCLPGHGVYAFGAGNIPNFAYMEGKAFRHGDIEDTLAEIMKIGGGTLALGGLLRGNRFGSLDIKRVYFGNWLRDYSQAVDIASLKKLDLQSIINLCMALGFLAHGYATHEFEVTIERIGVYLPTEHIDNPKGYGGDEDARKYNPNLRGPVDPQELEIDLRTGMKNYIANESGHWDTSKALVRRTIERCVHIGRMHRADGRKEDLYEAYRLLGQLLHTLEDFPAHSNFCELALVSMGHTEVFVHVGDQVLVQAPNGRMIAPLVTGTFGSSDFIHSLLGEATDHISEASVADLNKELSKARSKSAGPGATNSLRQLLFELPGGGGSEISHEMEGIERIRAGPTHGGKNPDTMSPQELHAVLWQVLTFRDSIVKKIEKTIEKVPGLQTVVQKIMDSISVFVYTTLEPFLKPILKTATAGLQSASSEVINNHDQFEVFNDPLASDPTHSFLSKDHFNMILNEPAGQLAKIILAHTASLVIKAWDDASVNVDNTAEDILKCLFHPDFYDPNSKIEREMMHYMQTWVQGLGSRQHDVFQRLTKDAVRNHRNIRLQGEGGAPTSNFNIAQNAGVGMQHQIGSYIHEIPGVAQIQSAYNLFSKVQGARRDMPGSSPGPAPPQPTMNSYPGSSQSSPYTPLYAPPTGPQGSPYAPPFGPPSQMTTSPGAPPSFSPGPSGGMPEPHPHRQPSWAGQESYDHHRHGYAPAYASFPSATGPGTRSLNDAQGGGGYSFPGPYGPPQGPPPPAGPGFPQAGPYGAPGGPPHFPGYQPPPGPPPGQQGW